jgi:hydroxyacylglutathione hydrolase
LKLFQIPARQDNYIYCAMGPENRAFVVDPADAEPVIHFLAQRPEITLEAIINTHHHHDHVGGNAALKAQYDLKIYGPAHDADRITGLTHPVHIGDEIVVSGLAMKVHDVKAHTRGHICFQTLSPFDEVYRQGHQGQETLIDTLGGCPALFVGDSLFLGGCGRLFEGTPEQLFEVMSFYHSLSGDHLVVCAHEYTESNLRFAAHVLPHDESIAQRLSGLSQEKGEAQSSVPDLLAKEFQTNPFLLVLEPEQQAVLQEKYQVSDVVSLLGQLRQAKDNF